MCRKLSSCANCDHRSVNIAQLNNIVTVRTPMKKKCKMVIKLPAVRSEESMCVCVKVYVNEEKDIHKSYPEITSVPIAS